MGFLLGGLWQSLLWVDEDVDAVLFHLNAEKVIFGRAIVVKKHGRFRSQCFEILPVLPATFGLRSVSFLLVLLIDLHAQRLTTLTSCSTGMVSTCQPWKLRNRRFFKLLCSLVACLSV